MYFQTFVKIVDIILAWSFDLFLMKFSFFPCLFSHRFLCGVSHEKYRKKEAGIPLAPPPKSMKNRLWHPHCFFKHFGYPLSNLFAPCGDNLAPFGSLFHPFASIWLTFGSFRAIFQAPSGYFGPELRPTSYLDAFARKMERETEEMKGKKVDRKNMGKIQIASSIVDSMTFDS